MFKKKKVQNGSIKSVSRGDDTFIWGVKYELKKEKRKKPTSHRKDTVKKYLREHVFLFLKKTI